MLNRSCTQNFVHLLVAIELVGQGVEEAVAIASYLACIQGIGLEYREFR